ncbi:MAG: hypothetical protein GYA78_00055 [Caldisericales bacterium]|jgi:hypothetical protein|nr:hypothetical protein [Caldisericia bacterium]NMD13738.1 hypothetical protein [Caldisericales bacterium]
MDNIDQDIIQQYASSLPEDQQMKFKVEYYGHRKNHWINLAYALPQDTTASTNFILARKMLVLFIWGWALAQFYSL